MLHVDFKKVDFNEYSIETMLLNEFLLTIEEIKDAHVLNPDDYLKILKVQEYLTIEGFQKILYNAINK